MKALALFAVVAAVALVCSASVARNTVNKFFRDRETKRSSNGLGARMEDFLKAFRDDAHKSAVNWTWTSWTDGPTCVPRDNLTLVDIPDEKIALVGQVIDSIMAEVVCRFHFDVHLFFNEWMFLLLLRRANNSETRLVWVLASLTMASQSL